MRTLAAFVSGRRTKWLVPGIWLLLIIVFAPLGSKLADETTDDTSSFLPKSAESTEVNDLLKERFASGQTVNGLIVYRRGTGLTALDRRKIAVDARRVQADVPVIGRPAVPFTPSGRGLVSSDGTLAYTVFSLRDDWDKLGDWGKDTRDITGDGGAGLEIWVTGDAGFAADFEEIFQNLDATLLLASRASPAQPRQGVHLSAREAGAERVPDRPDLHRRRRA